MILFIMRGVSGSGKSTIARQLAVNGGIVHSTDDYFYVDGEYVFDPHKLWGNHRKNFQAFCVSLEKKIPFVVCDNTNIRRWEFKSYAEAAVKAGYRVIEVAMPHPDPEVAAARCVHKVPVSVIIQKINQWEN